MRAPELISGLRVVAAPAELDAMTWADDTVVLRLAPDDLLVVGAAVGAAQPESAIVDEEHGFVGWWLTPEELAEVAHHVEWALTRRSPCLAQGLIAGVPRDCGLARIGPSSSAIGRTPTS